MFYNYIAAQSYERTDFGSIINEEEKCCFAAWNSVEIFFGWLIFSNKLV